MSDDSLDKAKSHWDDAYEGDHADQAHICNIYTLASVLYWQLYGNRCFGNTGGEYGWLSWLKRVYGATRCATVLELGSGNGDLLLDLRRMDFAAEFTGLDISEVGIQVASRKVAEAGYANVRFLRSDLNQIALEARAYDMIVAQMSLHHVENLERVFEQVAQALTPGGSFAANDYVGPTRWQFTAMQLILANLILQVLPRRLRVSHPDGKIKSGVPRPTIRQMIAMDPSEAVRSAEIPLLFRRYFTVEHRIDYGGSVSVLVLDNIINNFRAEDPSSVKWLRFILAVDHWARRIGLVPPLTLFWQDVPSMKAEMVAAQPAARETGGHSVAVPELALGGLMTALITWSLCAIVLAQQGVFRAWTLLLAGLIAGAGGLAFWWRMKPVAAPASRREAGFLALIVAAGLLLYAWPAEHIPLLGDSAIYPNTAARLIRDRGLTYRYEPLAGLSPAQKQLFYLPADVQLPGLPIQSYEGLLFGAYYVADPDQNLIVSSRPPLVIAWMGLFGKLFGLRGMVYVTPLFGALSLVVVYFVGKRVFGRGAGALAASWLLISFPQLHFSRTPYAEAVGQFFILTMLYGLIVYLQTRRAALLALGLAALTAAFAARLDAILTLPALLFFFLILVKRDDRQGLAIGLASLVAALGFTLGTLNRPYVGATAELLLAGQLRQLADPATGILMGFGGLTSLALLLLVVRRMPGLPWPRVVRGGLLVLLVAVVGYGWYIRPLAPEFAWVNGQRIATHNEEILAVAAQYVGAPLLWLAVAGAGWVLWRRRIFSEQTLIVVFLVTIAGVVFWKYTTARVYPVALRRLLARSVAGDRPAGRVRLAQPGPSAAAGDRSRSSWPGWLPACRSGSRGNTGFYREASGTWDFTADLAARVPSRGGGLVRAARSDPWSVGSLRRCGPSMIAAPFVEQRQAGRAGPA